MGLTRQVKLATTSRARPARRLAALQLVGMEPQLRLVAPCQTPFGTHPEGRPTAVSRVTSLVGGWSGGAPVQPRRGPSGMPVGWRPVTRVRRNQPSLRSFQTRDTRLDVYGHGAALQACDAASRVSGDIVNHRAAERCLWKIQSQIFGGSIENSVWVHRNFGVWPPERLSCVPSNA
jgi:hypothetical protein